MEQNMFLQTDYKIIVFISTRSIDFISKDSDNIEMWVLQECRKKVLKIHIY